MGKLYKYCMVLFSVFKNVQRHGGVCLHMPYSVHQRADVGGPSVSCGEMCLSHGLV